MFSEEDMGLLQKLEYLIYDFIREEWDYTVFMVRDIDTEIPHNHDEMYSLMLQINAGTGILLDALNLIRLTLNISESGKLFRGEAYRNIMGRAIEMVDILKKWAQEREYENS